MRHSLHVEGFGVRLRPVRLNDAAFIVWLRNQDYVKGKVGDSASDEASQRVWLEAYFQRNDDWYFIVETLSDIPVGTQGVYDVATGSAEFGRFIMRADVTAAVPTSVLTSDLAFRQMGLRELRATSVASNRKLHSYIRRLGFQQVKIEPAGRVIGGKPVDMLHFVQTAEHWFEIRDQVIPLARLAEIQIQDWERKQPRNKVPQSAGTTT